MLQRVVKVAICQKVAAKVLVGKGQVPKAPNKTKNRCVYILILIKVHSWLYLIRTRPPESCSQGVFYLGNMEIRVRVRKYLYDRYTSFIGHFHSILDSLYLTTMEFIFHLKVDTTGFQPVSFNSKIILDMCLIHDIVASILERIRLEADCPGKTRYDSRTV